MRCYRWPDSVFTEGELCGSDTFGIYFCAAYLSANRPTGCLLLPLLLPFFCCMLLVHDIANASTFFTAYNINSSGWTLTFHHRLIVCYGVTIAAMTVQVCERFPCISDSFLSGVADISFVSYSSAARLCANYAKCTNPTATVGIYTEGQQHLNALYCH